jgi:hypothetical protein
MKHAVPAFAALRAGFQAWIPRGIWSCSCSCSAFRKSHCRLSIVPFETPVASTLTGYDALTRPGVSPGNGDNGGHCAFDAISGFPMEIKVNFLDKLRLEAKFDDFTVIADQPIRYKGDGSAPGPFDYFLASSALCAAYFVKLYCETRNIPTDNIRLSQNNIVDRKTATSRSSRSRSSCRRISPPRTGRASCAPSSVAR